MTTDSIDAFYWLPHCSTCQRADAFLKERGVSVRKYIDVKTTQVDKDTIRQLAEKVGGVEKLFSKRALKYRALELHTKELSDEEMLDWMHKEYTFIRRPVVVTSTGKAVAGFSKKQFEELISS